MNKKELTDRLRSRLTATGVVPYQIAASLPSDEIIEAYTTCSCCGERIVEGLKLDALIEAAGSASEFVGFIEAIGKAEGERPNGPNTRH